MPDNVRSLFPDGRTGSKRKKGLIWIAPDISYFGSVFGGALESDHQACVAVGEIHRMLIKGEVAGLMFSVLRPDGKMEYGMTGEMIESPGAAMAAATLLKSLTKSWPVNPAQYLPSQESQEE